MYLVYLLSLFVVTVSGIGLFAPKSSDYLLFYPGFIISVVSLILVVLLWLLQILAALSKWFGSALLVLIGLALLGFSLFSILMPDSVSFIANHMSTADDMVSFVLAVAYILSGMEHETLSKSSESLDVLKNHHNVLESVKGLLPSGNKGYVHHPLSVLAHHRHDHRV